MDATLDDAREFVAVRLALSAAEIDNGADVINRDILSVIDEFATASARAENESPPPTPST